MQHDSKSTERVGASSPLDHALFYTSELKWRVFPCYTIRYGRCSCKRGADCDSPGKHPKTRNGRYDATDDEQAIRRWWSACASANVSITTGNGLVVLDVDADRGGYESLEQLERQLGPLPRTMTVKTGGGGMHIYAKVPSSVRVRSTELAPGIELKGEGGSIIAPPSRHVSGEQYVWSVLRIDGPHLVPEAWLKQMPKQLGPLPCDLPARKRTRKSARKSRSRQLPSPHTPITICATSKPKQKAARSGDPLTKRAKPQTPAPTPPITICALPADDPLLSPFTDTGKRVWATVRRCLVTEPGTTNHQITALVTSLKNIPALADVPATNLLPAVHWWWERSAPHMKVKNWPANWKRWQYLWLEWSEEETGAAWRARDYVLKNPLPDAAERYRKPAKRDLVGLCYAMQAEVGEGVWFISWRTAMDVLNSMGHDVSLGTAGNWLRGLVRDEILIKPWQHERGSPWAQRYQLVEVAARAVRPIRRAR